MIETCALVYGLLTTFVLSGAERNRRATRPNPRMLERVGYVLCGFSGAASLLLLSAAIAEQPLFG